MSLRMPDELPLLAPLGLLYGLAAAMRVALYRRGLLARTRLAGPVISLGNRSVGGSGKTPLVAHLAGWLHAAGLPVAILSRGYRGRFQGECLVVSDGRQLLSDAGTAGDEPVMLARELPGVVVAVGPQRDIVGRAVEARFGRRVHLLDDGFQHLRLERDLDLLCLDALDTARWPLPAGRLRELPSAAGRADLILLTRADRAGETRLGELEARHGRERTLRVRQPPQGFADAQSGASVDVPQRPYLVSGIARPERLEADVRVLCGGLAGQRAFRDHHAFSAAELLAVEADARATGADALVTTAKDLVRWPTVSLGLPVRVLRLGLEIEDEQRLRERVLAVAHRAA